MTRMHILVLIALAMMIATPWSAWAQTYYVDGQNPEASDTNPGTPDQPWSTVDRAVSRAAAGDTVIFRPGNYGRMRLRNRHGEPGRMIIFRGQSAPDRSRVEMGAFYNHVSPTALAAYPERNAVLAGATLQDSSYIRVENFEITAIEDRSGVYVGGSSYCEIAGNFLHDLNPAGQYNGGGISLYNHENQYILIEKNFLYRVLGVGISIMGKECLVKGNEVAHGIDTNSATGNYEGGDVDAMRFFGSGHIIRGNYLHDYNNTECRGDPHMDAFQTFSVYPDSQFAHNILVEGNWCVNFGQMFMCSDTAESEGVTNAVYHIVFRNNVFIGSRAYSIMIRLNSDYFTFDHNLVADPYYGPIFIGDAGHHATVKNNIFYHGAAQLTDEASKPGSAWDYNLYVPDFTWPIKQPEYDRHSVFGKDPKLVNPANPLGPDGLPFTEDDGFRLQAGSPARGAAEGGLDMGPYQTLYEVQYNWPLEESWQGWQNRVKVYPNPYKPGTGGLYDRGEGVFFQNLPPRALIRIFDMAGSLVWENRKEDYFGTLCWTAVNSRGNDVQSGVYLYTISNLSESSETAKGKIVIIR